MAAAASLAGIAVAYLWFYRRRVEDHGHVPGIGPRLERFWFEGWGFDRLYDRVFVRPFVFLAGFLRDDHVDRLYRLLAELAARGHRALRPIQNGRLRWYAAALALGTVLVVAMVVLP